MTDNNYDIFVTLKFTSHYSSKLANDETQRQKIYTSYWQKVNDIIYGKRNTAHKGLKTEQVQHFGENDSNAHIHARVKCPSFMDIEVLCILLNTVWKAKFYEKASSPKYNHITPIIDNDRVYGYITRQQNEVDVTLSNLQTDDTIENTEAKNTKAQQRLLRFFNTPHIQPIFNIACMSYPKHVQYSTIHLQK